MEKFNIDKQVITLAFPPVWQKINHKDALSPTKMANNEVNRIANEYSDYFIPVATLPHVNAEFLAEFDRCVDELGMAGIQIFSNIDGFPP